MWLKALVALTCFAILGAIGFWFWQHRLDAERIDQARLLAGARECWLILDQVKAGQAGFTVGHIAVCVENYITEADVRDAGLGFVIDENPALFAPAI